MSMQALLLAVRDRVRDACAYLPDQCDIQPDGAPDPVHGEVYVAVFPLGFRNNDAIGQCLDEEYDIGITLTMRSAWLPVDQYGPELVSKSSTGLYARAEVIRAAVHMDYNLMTAANTTIGASENGFIEPLRFRSCSEPRPQGASWFHGDGEAEPPSGITVELRFGGARRVQVIEEQS